MSPAWPLALHILLLAKRDDLLELDARRRLHDAIGEYPGLHLRELARRTELSAKHVEYHLRRLEKAGVVTSKQEDRYRRYYPTAEGSTGRRDVVDRHQKKALALLRRPVPLHIVLLLLDRGAMDHGSLKEAVGIGHGTLSYHLKNLAAQGVVTARPEGRRRVFQVADAEGTEALLLQYRPPDELMQGFIETWEAFAL